MTAAELIAALGRFPPDAIVYIQSGFRLIASRSVEQIPLGQILRFENGEFLEVIPQPSGIAILTKTAEENSGREFILESSKETQKPAYRDISVTAKT